MATLNNGLKTIELGSINWRSIFNSNMQKLDISTIQFITYAELPTVFVGDRMYFTTDKLKFYYDDGTQLLEVIGGIIQGLDADKDTNTENGDFYYATDTNILYYKDDTGTIINVTGSVDFSAVDQSIIPDVNWSRNLGASDKTWGRGYFTYIYADKIYSKSSGELTIDAFGNNINFAENGTIRSYIGPNISFTPTGTFRVSTANTVTLNSSDSIQLQTGTTTRMSINPSLINILEFTALGDLSPSIKLKKITGTTGAAEGDIVTVAHNLTGSKIISFKLKVEDATDSGIPENHTSDTGYQVSIKHDGTNFIITNVSSNSANVLSKPFSILVTYEA